MRGAASSPRLITGSARRSPRPPAAARPEAKCPVWASGGKAALRRTSVVLCKEKGRGKGEGPGVSGRERRARVGVLIFRWGSIACVI